MAEPAVSVAELAAQAWADQLDQQSAIDEQSRKQQQAAQAEIGSAQQAFLRKLTNRQQEQPIPAPVQEIVNVLVSQPRFVEPTQLFLQELVKRVSAAVDEVISAATGPIKAKDE